MICKSVRSKLNFGLFVITVSLVSTGCATRQPMHAMDLEYFQPDCKIKQQQIAMLQSMRVSADDRLVNAMANMIQPWKRFTNPDQAYQRQQIASGRTEWLINQNIMTLVRNCP